jgi:hypothetical protein
LQREALHAIGKGAVTLLVCGALAQLCDSYLESNPLLGAVLGVVAVDLLGRRVGLAWDESPAARAWAPALALARGFGLGAALALGSELGAVALGWAEVRRGTPSLLGLGLGLALALATALRDELLFRGVPLAAARGLVRDRHLLPFSALLGAAPLVLAPGASVLGPVLAAAGGALFAVLWRAGGGVYVAWGAHAGWLFVAGAGSHGALLEVRMHEGILAPVAQARGAPAWLAALVLATAALGTAQWYARRARAR